MKKLDDKINNTILAIVGVLYLLGSVIDYTSLTFAVLSIIFLALFLRLLFLLWLKKSNKKPDNIIVMQDYAYEDRTIS